MVQKIKNLVVLAIIMAGAYYLWNWNYGGAGSNEFMDYAERSCVDAIRNRFDATAVSSNSVRENADGFVIRATITLERGGTARVTCLTNQRGSVTDVSVYEN